jgi:uncharacterized GH25 family protein
MKSRFALLAALVFALMASPALAHFVWVAVEKDSAGVSTAQVWFSELAEADAANLIDKIAAVKVWTRKDGKSQPVAVTKQIKGDLGALAGSVPAGATNLSAHINYGVLTRREQTFLLMYSAKYLEASAADLKAVARDESLPLDVVPQPGEKEWSLEVLYKGKPVAGSDVVILDPQNNESEVKTDEAGRVKLGTLKPGLYSIRAKWTVAEAGKEGDKEYPQVNHYCTLALRVAK